MKNLYLSLLLLCLPLNLFGMQLDCGDIQRSNAFLTTSLQNYVELLPKITHTSGASLAESIVSFLCAFIPGEKTDLHGHDALALQVQEFIDRAEPIKFSMAGFPAKSANAEKKVISPAFDAADYVGLCTLHYICTQIQSVYPVGAQVTILPWEVYLFAANTIIQKHLGEGVYFFGREQFNNYQQSLKELCASTFNNVQIEDYPEEVKNAVYQALCVAIETIPPYDVNAQRLPDEQFIANELDCAMFRDAVRKQLPKINDRGIDKFLKMVAYYIAHCFAIGRDLMRPLRNDCYGKTIYLSVRQPDDVDISRKLAVGLVHGSLGTPWHHMLVIDAFGCVSLTTREVLDRTDKAFRECRGMIAGAYVSYASRS